MKKSKYLSKYDFIAYYSKPKSFWFFTNDEVQAAIDVEYQKMNLHSNDEEQEEDLEIDSFEIYKELLEENQNIDQDNPLMIEGNIIDKNSRAYIEGLYDEDFESIDLDDAYPKTNNEKKALITKELIQKYPKLILFQSVFITKINKIDIITKPDAIVIENKTFHLYETKATSSAKKHHFLDVYFQGRLIESISEFKNQFDFKYYLCIVAFEFANKMECPLIDSPYCNISKSVTFSITKFLEDFNELEKVIDVGQSIKMGEWTSKSVDFEYYPISLTNFVHHNLNEIITRYEAPGIRHQTKKSCDRFSEDALLLFANFEKILQELFDHKMKMTDLDIPQIIKPGYGDKSPWKDNDNFLLTRSIYVQKGCELLKYSGFVLDQSVEAMIKYQPGDVLSNYVKTEKNKAFYDETLFGQIDVTIFSNACANFMSEIKPKKVYFDFETVNTAIRAYDHTLPFRQIITQSSVIVDHNDGSDLDCQNLIVDPANVDENWFRKIVDSLYYGNQFSYIVYNKSFERSRLNEISEYLNDPKITQKIGCIISNMVDLADLFDVRKKLIIFKELCGFYSIKKVLPLVSKYDQKIFDDVKCLDYKKLEVGNGKLCQDVTTKRFFNLMDKAEWDKTAVELQKYCENDVRAMVAVEYFAKKILQHGYSNFKVSIR